MRARYVIMATIVWFVIAWNIFDPMSTILFQPVKIADADYYRQIDELNAKFLPLMFGPPIAAWIGWFLWRKTAAKGD